MQLPPPCPYCGCEYIKITMWGGPNGGGELILCDNCGMVLGQTNYNKEETWEPGRGKS